jgi:BASS family bile acid:Na+ symporter
MTLAQLILYAVNVSIFAIVLALGLTATIKDATHLLRNPGLLFRSILSMNVIMAVFAVVAALVFDLDRAVKIAIVALAVSPVPPVLPTKQRKAGGSQSYAIGLLVAASVVAIVLAPLTLEILGLIFGTEAHIPAGKVASIVLISVIVPLAIGLAIHQMAPAWAERIAKPLSLIATILLVLAVVPVLFKSWPAVWAMVGNGVLIVLVLFTLIGVAVGHALGGPDPDDRTVLALATATRHPGVAIAIASLNFPEETAVQAVVLYHLVIGAIVSLPYVNWRKRTHAAKVEP